MTAAAYIHSGLGRRALRATILVLLLAGLTLVAKASWIDTKAWLAQQLLERAWSRAQDGAKAARPWPRADTYPLARLRFVDRDASYVVLSGASGRTLAFAPGHIDGTALPGSEGNVGIAGHRDTHFRILREVRRGDRIELETPRGERATYRVTSAAVVDQSDTDLLHEGAHRVTLVTCYPFDAVRPGGPLRWVVVAEHDSFRSPGGGAE
jgi:sortase A